MYNQETMSVDLLYVTATCHFEPVERPRVQGNDVKPSLQKTEARLSKHKHRIKTV